MSVDLSTRVGAVALRTPVLAAAGTAGYGAELSGYGNLAELGAVVTKSLASFEWAGNPAPRVAPMGSAMLNSVGLAGPGVGAWRRGPLEALRATGATVVASIWGRSVEEFAEAAEALCGADVCAVEVNASCPNLAGEGIFAHSADLTAELVRAAAGAGLPRWVKLSPNTPDLVEIAGAALAAGAEGLVLVNTLRALALDLPSGRPALGAGPGGMSGRPLLPVALRAVFECRAAHPGAAIIGVGGIASGEDAAAMLMAGADAVEVGTATLADPRAPWRIQRQLARFMHRHRLTAVHQLVGRSHAH